MSDEPGGPLARGRQWVGRVKATPARLERLEDEALEALRTNLRTALDQIWNDLASQGRAQFQARAEIVTRLGGLENALAELEYRTSGRLRRHLDELYGPRRDQAFESLMATLGPPAPTQPGLSVLTVTWNHAKYLERAVRNALAVLDAAGDAAGEVLIFDDASTDTTPELLAALTADDARIRCVRAPENMAHARGRNVMIHLARTSHVVVLDADNVLDPASVAAAYEIAQRLGAAWTHGTLVDVTDTGEPIGVVSTVPAAANLYEWPHNLIDTMSIVDVEVIRRLGGYTTDAVLQWLDDWDMLHRLARAGELIVQVPVVLGHKVADPLSISLSAQDHETALAKIRRNYRGDGALARGRSAVVDPTIGVIWSNDPELPAQPVPAPLAAAPAATVLIVAPGGVRNTGDDAITAEVAARVRSLVAPTTHVAIITDGPDPRGLPDGVWWLGSAAAPGLVVPRADLAIIAGGGWLSDSFVEGPLGIRAHQAESLRRVGAPFIVSGLGAGPLDTERGSMLAREVLMGARSIATRDPASAALVERLLGDDAPDITFVGDDALGLAPAPDAVVDALVERAGIAPSTPYFVFHARESSYAHLDRSTLEAWADALDAHADGQRASIVAVALNDQHVNPELGTLLEIARSRPRAVRWAAVEATDPATLRGLLARGRGTVATSYHAALLTLAGGVPSVLLAGTPYAEAKAEGLRSLFGLPPALCAGPGDPAEVSTRLAEVEGVLRARDGASSAALDDWFGAHLGVLAAAG